MKIWSHCFERQQQHISKTLSQLIFCPLSETHFALYFAFCNNNAKNNNNKNSTHNKKQKNNSHTPTTLSLFNIYIATSLSQDSQQQPKFSFSKPALISNKAISVVPVSSSILPHPTHTVEFGTRRFSTIAPFDLLLLEVNNGYI